MPSVNAAIEYLQHLKAKGRGQAPVHIVDIEMEQQKRSTNEGPPPKTRFQIELDSAELYREWNAEKDRIIKHVKNKSLALDLMWRAWHESLSARELDRLMAEQDGPDA